MLKILAIGNSFSEDATFYLKKIADSANVDMKVVNLYIGGCSLEMHSQNIKNDAKAYRYELNGVYTDKTVSIKETLEEEKWDIVTVQQVSHLTGVYESYGENLTVVLDCVKKYAPQAKIYFHQTWAYEVDSTHSNFSIYNSQLGMADAIEKVSKKICMENGNLPIIPTGRTVKELRRHQFFDYENGGQSICRDGFHLSLVYGRYLAGLVWFATLLNGNIDEVKFVPAENDIVNGYSVQNFECDLEKINVIKEIVKSIIN